MKYFHLVVIQLVCLSFAFSQRMEVPKDNPGNGLDLKIVFQEYTVTTHHANGGYSTQTGQYPLLKVNGVYLKKGYTGINKTEFNNYLGNCPEALDIGLDGLDTYKKSKWANRLSFIGGFGLMAAGGLTVLNDNSKLGGTLLGAGLASYLGLRFASNRLNRKGDQKVVDAFGHYMESCYDPSMNTYEYVEDNDVSNGETNENDSVYIKVLTNNPKTFLASFGPSGAMGFLEDGFLGYGADATFYKRGLYFDVLAHKLKSMGTIQTDLDTPSSTNEYNLRATVGVPIVSRVRKGKLPLLLGKVQGFLTSGIIEDVGVATALSVRGGVNTYRQINYSEFDDFKRYISTSTLVKAGLSWSSSTELSFGIDDNRYSEDTRYAMSNVILYVDVVYNLDTDYEIIPSTNPFDFLNGTEDPSHRDIGIALGLNVKQTGDSRLFAKSLKLEFGYLPINNGASGIYGMCSFGFNLYKVNRKKV